MGPELGKKASVAGLVLARVPSALACLRRKQGGWADCLEAGSLQG